ncbi:hypothetical protein [uncultured Dialister sp.]|uniref:hypothetical protein n=1 Tax=uncultured Dialister sp. TaxID=278064 RepID=UPI0026025570|nr:hypothetical protein [uncultured Dialister sp.]
MEKALKVLEKLKKLLLPLTKKLKANDQEVKGDLSLLHKEQVGPVERRVISPWGRRRIRHRRSNHPWVKGK